MPNLHDVARLCGFSARTVSRVINGEEHVTEKTRKRVMEAASQLGYKPDPSARALKLGRKQIIGIVVNTLSSDTTFKRIEYITKKFSAAGYAVMVRFAGGKSENAQTEDSAIESVVPWCDGLIVFSNLAAPYSAVLDQLEAREFPFLLIDPPLSVRYPALFIDRQGGYRDATRYLLQKGRKKPLLLLEEFRSLERLAGFKEGLAAEGIPFTDSMVIRTMKEYQGGISAAAEIAAGVRQGRVDSALCHNDKMALALMSVFAKEGIRVPEDIAVVGYDDDAFDAYTTPSLSSIAQNGDDVGSFIFEQIKARIETGAAGQSRTVGTRLVPRGSS